MSINALHKIFCKFSKRTSTFFILKFCRLVMKTRDDGCNFASFKHLKQGVRNIENTGLEKENQRNPLVISFVLNFISFFVIFSNSWMNYILPPLPCKVLGEGEGAHDEAVGVHDVLGNGPVVRVTILDAGDVDAVADVLDTGDEDAADQEDDAGHSVVELGDDTLGLGVGNLL